MVKQFNRTAAAEGIPWRATWRPSGSKELLLGELQRGRPVTILRVWKGGGAHYQTVIGYNADKDTLVLLEPGEQAPRQANNPDRRIIEESWAALDADWRRRAWWGYVLEFPFGIQRGMITYSPIPVATQAPIASPLSMSGFVTATLPSNPPPCTPSISTPPPATPAPLPDTMSTPSPPSLSTDR